MRFLSVSCTKPACRPCVLCSISKTKLGWPWYINTFPLRMSVGDGMVFKKKIYGILVKIWVKGKKELMGGENFPSLHV